MSTPPFDLSKAHRWFAIELNNRAWELIEAPARTAEEAVEMVTAAHAAGGNRQVDHAAGSSVARTLDCSGG